ncbi:hypothetical protein ACFQX6_37560 [Streptosporangium lutulentum]
MRSAGNERAVEIMRDHLEQHYQRDLADALSGPDPEMRAALLIAVCTGMQMQRNVLGNRALLSSDSDMSVDLLAAALDLIGASDAPAPASGDTLPST